MIFRILLKLYDPLWTNETAMSTTERCSPYTVVCSERVDNRVFDLLVELMCIKAYKCSLFDYQHFFSLFVAFTGERVFKWKMRSWHRTSFLHLIPTYHWCQSHSIAVYSCQSKVRNLHLAGFRDQDILWLQVSMNYAMRMQEIDTIQQLMCDVLIKMSSKEFSHCLVLKINIVSS